MIHVHIQEFNHIFIMIVDDMKLKTKMDLQKNDKNQVKISFMIFRTGSILIVGKCEENIIYYIYNFIKNIIEKENFN